MFFVYDVTGQPQNVGQQQFSRMSNFNNQQRVSPGFSPQGGAMEVYSNPGPMTQPPMTQQAINGGQQYSLTATPPIQGQTFPNFPPPYKQGMTMTSPDLQQFNGLSPPLTSQSPKAKKPRVRKFRKNSSSKSKGDLKRKQSSDEPPWTDISPSIGGNLLSPPYCHPVADSPPLESKKSRKKVSRRSIMQMTIGDMHQRLQPTPQDTDTSSSIMTPGSASQIVTSRPQTLNLNDLLNQYKQRQDGQNFPVSIKTGNFPGDGARL